MKYSYIFISSERSIVLVRVDLVFMAAHAAEEARAAASAKQTQNALAQSVAGANASNSSNSEAAAVPKSCSQSRMKQSHSSAEESATEESGDEIRRTPFDEKRVRLDTKLDTTNSSQPQPHNR